MTKPKISVAFLGLGTMGEPMARNLILGGYKVHLYNRTQSKGDALIAQGGLLYRTPLAAAKGADIIITMVTDSPDVHKLLFGPDGAVYGAKPKTLFIDMSTISPAAARELADELKTLNFKFIDAPVTGGDTGARNATLTILVGGDIANFERAKPLFLTLGKRAIHCGPVGSGQTMKACNQIGCAGALLTTIEMLSFATLNGLKLEQVIEALQGGAAGSWQFSNLGPKIAIGNDEPGFRAQDMLKDLDFVIALATRLGLELPNTYMARQLLQNNVVAGEGQLGTQAMAHAFLRLFRQKT